MHIDVRHRPAESVAHVKMNAGESIRAESGAMLAMVGGIKVETNGPASSGGLLKSLKRKVLGAESFFTNTFKATDNDAAVWLAPRLPGDMVVHEVNSSHELMVQGGSFVAAPMSVSIDTRFEGLGGLFSGEGLFFLKIHGHGPVVLNAFGAIDAIDLDGELIVDTGHLVAFTSGVGYTVQKAADDWLTSLLSGEGLVLHLKGKGRVYLQTRNPDEYGKAAGRHLAPIEH